MRAIDADALIKAIIQMPPNGNLFDCIHNVPTIEPERKKGKWTEAYEDDRKQIGWYECSECKYAVSWKPNFCPNCGADMREEE